MTNNVLLVLSGFMLGSLIGITIMATLKVGRESDKDFDRLPSVWFGLIEMNWSDNPIYLVQYLVQQVQEHGIYLYVQNRAGDFEFVGRLGRRSHPFTSRKELEEFVRNYLYEVGPCMTNEQIEALREEQIGQEDEEW